MARKRKVDGPCYYRVNRKCAIFVRWRVSEEDKDVDDSELHLLPGLTVAAYCPPENRIKKDPVVWAMHAVTEYVPVWADDVRRLVDAGHLIAVAH